MFLLRTRVQDHTFIMILGWELARKRILIKFTHCYESAVRELAPALYGCEDVLESLGWTMVAMEYLPLTDWVLLASKTRALQKKYGPKKSGCSPAPLA